ncbi:BT_3928 family protein [Penaeicola halotolerans]|uniref:BT_3928 family protein n=1 Tax=Penaeicola halotolerans TaxID=2793196 RepID=UPI001CF8BB94|nr:BT_3928 family protein [Penaeicola halotolerans]
MKKILLQFSLIFVGALFIFSGLIKINDPVGFGIKLEEYFDVFANDIAGFFDVFKPWALPIAIFVSVIEVWLGLALLFKYRLRLVAHILLGMILFFTFLTFYSAYFNKVTDCGCFGDAIPLTPWQSFIKDIILLVFIGFIWISRKSFSVPHKAYKRYVIGSIAILTYVLAIIAVNHLPFKDFRAYKVGRNIPADMQPSGQINYAYKVKFPDGREETLTTYPEEEVELLEMIVTNPEVMPKITDFSIWNDEGDQTELAFTGTKLFIIIYNVQKSEADNYKVISELIDQVEQAGIVPVILTASSEADIEALRFEHQLAAPFYYADATVLKTIIRSNPGLMLVSEGTILGKWHHNDTPSLEEISTKLNQ